MVAASGLDSLLASPTAETVSVSDYTFFQRDDKIYKILYSDFVETFDTMDALETEDGYYIETETLQLLEYEARIVVESGDVDLVIDTTPTFGSAYPVTSSGIKSALELKQDKLDSVDVLSTLEPSDYVFVQRGDKIYKCLYANLQQGGGGT
jgi:hypothetical protein